MSVLLETSAGDIVIDLLVDHAPKLCEKSVPTPTPLQLFVAMCLLTTMHL